MILHGHQGQPIDDPERFKYSRWIVRNLWAPIGQRLLGQGNPVSASRFGRIRRKRDRLLYEWARKNKMLLVAGHTHRAMFLSESQAAITHVEQYPAEQNADVKREVPCYFNAGCCLYVDGITGIELEDGEIRLVKWTTTEPDVEAEQDSASPRDITRQVFQTASLQETLQKVKNSA